MNLTLELSIFQVATYMINLQISQKPQIYPTDANHTRSLLNSPLSKKSSSSNLKLG